MTKLKDELNDPNNEYIQSVARCLQMMLRIDQYRIEFVALDGVSSIIKVLRGKVNFQIQYQLSFCLWVLTFNITIAEKLNAYGVIPVLADILADAQKEKVSRIILAVFRVSTYQGRRNRGPPPEFLRLSKVELSQSAPSNQGLTVLAPPDFFTFRRLCEVFILT